MSAGAGGEGHLGEGGLRGEELSWLGKSRHRQQGAREELEEGECNRSTTSYREAVRGWAGALSLQAAGHIKQCTSVLFVLLCFFKVLR